MAAKVYRDLARDLRSLVHAGARQASPPPERFRVVKVDPLTIKSVRDSDLVLIDGDDDFDISSSVRDAELSNGDIVMVHVDEDGDFIAAAATSGGSSIGSHKLKTKGVHGLPAAPTNGRGVVWNSATQSWDVASDFNARLGVLETALATQHSEGTNVAYYNSHGGAGSVDLTKNGATGPMTLSYTPTIDVWWDLTICVGLIQKNDTAYHYMECFGQMTAGAIPAIPALGMTAVAAGTAFMYGIHTGRLDVQTYTSFHLNRRVPLTAGVAYTFKARLSAQGGNWSYYQAPDRLYLQGRVFPR